MTEEQFLKIKAAGIKKWQEAVKQPEEDELYVDWWIKKGGAQCSFCDNFICDYLSGIKTGWPPCPLDDEHCADEWHDIDDMIDNEPDYSVFIQNAKAMLKRIENLEYDSEWAHFYDLAIGVDND